MKEGTGGTGGEEVVGVGVAQLDEELGDLRLSGFGRSGASLLVHFKLNHDSVYSLSGG